MTNVNGMKPMRLDYVSNKMTQLSLQAQSEYRRICGQKNWLASQFRSDILFDICHLSAKLGKAIYMMHSELTKFLRN